MSELEERVARLESDRLFAEVARDADLKIWIGSLSEDEVGSLIRALETDLDPEHGTATDADFAVAERLFGALNFDWGGLP